MIRNGWLRKHGKAMFTFGSQSVALEVDAGVTLVSGDCTPKLEVDGKKLELVSEVGVSSYVRIDGGEFIELELDFGDYKIERQLLLLSDEIFFINDVVRGDEAAELNYECRYSVSESFELLPEKETNEFYVRDGDHFNLVLPLFMPEWKVEQCAGSVNLNDSQIVVKQTSNGKGMAVPLVIDLNQKRSLKPRTWRRLTVAEAMQKVGPDVAVAYRLQIGNEQWLIYRTVGPRGNRTFLGQNFAEDFFFAKIDRDGTVTPLLEVE